MRILPKITVYYLEEITQTRKTKEARHIDDCLNKQTTWSITALFDYSYFMVWASTI